jgi:hypothetical protein
VWRKPFVFIVHDGGAPREPSFAAAELSTGPNSTVAATTAAAAATLSRQVCRPAFQTADRLVSYSSRYGCALRCTCSGTCSRVIRAAGTRTSDVFVMRLGVPGMTTCGSTSAHAFWKVRAMSSLSAARRRRRRPHHNLPAFYQQVQEESAIAAVFPAGIYDPGEWRLGKGDLTVTHWLFTAAQRRYDFVWSVESDVRWIGNYGELWNASLAAADAPDSAYIPVSLLQMRQDRQISSCGATGTLPMRFLPTGGFGAVVTQCTAPCTQRNATQCNYSFGTCPQPLSWGQ